MFTHLHTHSHYSLLDGLSKIDELISEAKKYGMKSLALTDHGVMYGIIEFYKKAKEAGIKPTIGVETYLAPNGRLQKRPKIDDKPYHLVLLAKNDQGYKNLIKLITLAHLEGFYYRPRIDWEILKEYHEGLIALTACLQGEIPRAILAGNQEKVKNLIHDYLELFGEDFYLELQKHQAIPEQEIVNRALIDLAKQYKIDLVATNDVHYLRREDAEIQDILLCLQTKKKKSDKDRLMMDGDDFYFKSREEMEKLFSDLPEAISQTEKISQKCNLELELGKTKLPVFIVPENLTPDQYLRKLVDERIGERFKQITPEIKNRIKYELEVIAKTKFASYFLIVQDFVNWAKNNDIVVGPGRGSAAGSIVSYILRITNIDPIKYNLVFERFLNPARIALPDIDLDFADTRRDEVIHYVEDKYGKDHVAQIITFGTMAARAAVRDVGRVLDYPYSFCDRLAKMIPPFRSLEQALSEARELKEFYETNIDAKKIIDSAKKIEGVARHASTHACGVVITPEPLVQYLPTQYDVVGDQARIITQYEMNSVEDLGLLKMDFLGLKNLTLIEEAKKIIKYNHKKEIDVNNLPLDDKKTFTLLKKCETTGVFQLESEGMKRYLKQLKPTDIEDIIAMVALYRPGPIELIPDYIAGKHGLKQSEYLHSKLKPILEKTYGVIVYQEQLLQIVRDLAGFSLAEADVLRKAVGKKIPKLLKEQREKFIQGCLKNKIRREIAEKIFALIEPFAGYGFNRSHAASYAMIAYQTAYLKANFPVEFMAALLTSDQNDIDRIAIEVEECRQMGIEVLPPDINESFKTFTVVGPKKIRFGLLAIKNIGSGIVQAIKDERKENGAFQNLEDFLTRVKSKDLNKKSLESLIKCGAFDNFGERGNLLGNLERLLEFNKKIQRDQENGQTTLFGILPFFSSSKLNLKNHPPVSREQKLIWEKELLGLYVSEHPFKEYKSRLDKIVTPCASVTNRNNSRYNLKVAGVITKIKKILTNQKETMLFAKIEDDSGSVEVVVFPNLFKTMPDLWHENKTILVKGRLSDKDGLPKIMAEEVQEITAENIEKIVRNGTMII